MGRWEWNKADTAEEERPGEQIEGTQGAVGQDRMFEGLCWGMLTFQELSRTALTKMQDVVRQLSCPSLDTPVPFFLLKNKKIKE